MRARALSYVRMHRCTPLFLVAVAAALPGAPPAAARERPPLAATLEECQTGASPSERIAVFTGSMPAVAGTERMAMRFDLQRRTSHRPRWRRVRRAPGFGAWERSLPNRAGFVFHKRVDGLRVPAAYRAVVRFRWYAADGAVQRRAQRRTRSCRQPDSTVTAAPDSEAIGADAGERRVTVSRAWPL